VVFCLYKKAAVSRGLRRFGSFLLARIEVALDCNSDKPHSGDNEHCIVKFGGIR